jgi:hypothetical protein
MNVRLPKFTIILVILSFGSFGVLAEEPSSYSSLLSEYKKGNYSFVASRAKEAIVSTNYLPKDERILLLYTASDSDWKEMDRILEGVYSNSKERSTVLYNSIYLYMERCLVLGNTKMVEKWGYRFRLEAASSPKYLDGLYVYASMFYESKRPKDSLFIISIALKEKPSPGLAAKLERIRSAILSENKSLGMAD